MRRAPLFIAEASSNHGRDLSRALAFVDAAADCGCDAVKFQLFKIDRMFAPEILAQSEKHRARREWELPRDHLAPLAEHCLKRRIQFSCTPFYLEAVEELRPFVAFYKIASYELLVTDLLEACARTGKPIVLSTGMATMPEIVRAAQTLRDAGSRDVTLLHCVSAYPTPIADANLSAIETIRAAAHCPVGWSDHTRKPSIVERAVHRWGASVVEFHLDLDGHGAEYAAGHCWLPDEIAPVIARIRESLVADGEGFKGPQPSELSDRDWRADPIDGMRPLRHVRAQMGAGRMSTREHLRIVAVIQARMGSTRLPGKVLKPIAGQPLLWHIVHRLKASHLIEDVAVATTTNPRDGAIVEFGQLHGVTVVRGPEDDVLARFARAAEVLDADVIVRVSSDAPFIDAPFIDHLVASMIEQGGDYVLLEDGAVTAHEGVDPFTRRALDKLMMDAHDDPVAREHVTGYFKLHPDFVPIARAKPFPPLAREAGRLTIDTPDDLAFVEAVHARLDAKAGEASLGDLLLLLEREPALRTNAHVKQKQLGIESGGLALIRCDGGAAFGYGHVKRMVALARALRDREGMGVVFAVNGSDDALVPIRRAGFEADAVGADAKALQETIRARRPDMLVLDCREGPSREAVLNLDAGLIAVIDDASERRLAADVAYYPPVPQADALDWSGSHCAARIGWEWSLLGLAPTPPRPKPLSPRPTLLVAMGGSDPAELTLRTARALTRLDPIFRARFVIGPGMKDREKVAAAIVKLKSNFETIEGADDLATEYASADLALAAFGVTAYELAYFGVPALYLCLTEDHALSASAFEYAGMGISLGLAEQASDERVAKSVLALLGDAQRRREMHQAGRMTIDGNAAARIAADLVSALAGKRGLSRAKAAS